MAGVGSPTAEAVLEAFDIVGVSGAFPIEVEGWHDVRPNHNRKMGPQSSAASLVLHINETKVAAGRLFCQQVLGLMCTRE